jgi:CRISPR-associated protein Csm2
MSRNRPSDEQLRTIITDPGGADELVKWADTLGSSLAKMKLSTNQIRALFGEVRQIQGEWSIEGHREQALRRLILLKPKMAYRQRKERSKAVRALVDVLGPAVNLVVEAPPKPEGASPGGANTQDDNFQRFVEFFEAILAYHKAYGGN